MKGGGVITKMLFTALVLLFALFLLRYGRLMRRQIAALVGIKSDHLLRIYKRPINTVTVVGSVLYIFILVIIWI